jgi:mono/diheme cytochrome c family protein
MRLLALPRVRRALVLAILAAGAVGLVAYDQLRREQPAPSFDSDEDHFLYGSIGTEASGVPFWIWLVLPRIFPEYLPGPGGYATLGIVARDGHEMPIGLSKVTIGIPRVGVNCAFCHTASVRTGPRDIPTVFPGAPGHQLSAQAYLRFLVACASDPRFTADTILGEIARNVRLSLLQRLTYRFVVIPSARHALLRLGDDPAWNGVPDRGHGRTDLPARVKVALLHQPAGDAVGSADSVPLWNLARRDGKAYHWDGSNPSLRDVVRAWALAEGSTRWWMDRDQFRWDPPTPGQRSSLRRVVDYVSSLKAPAYPFPVDATLARAGASVFAATCAECHAVGGARTDSVIPIDEVATDRQRLDAWTSAAAAGYNAFGEGHAWAFSSFRKTNGYVALPLDGVWLSAPYLHNGSVPTLSDLLEVPANRPGYFWRGYDVYDPARVGFITQGPEAERAGSPFDIRQPGNGNAGHTYGTTLSAGDKRALLEYLKTR